MRSPATTLFARPAVTGLRSISPCFRRRSALSARNDASPVAELAIEMPRSPRLPTRASVRPRLSVTMIALTLTGVSVSFFA